LKNTVKELIAIINSTKDYFLKNIEEKMDSLNKVIDLIKKVINIFIIY
jgi:homoserine dehydrogenase